MFPSSSLSLSLSLSLLLTLEISKQKVKNKQTKTCMWGYNWGPIQHPILVCFTRRGMLKPHVLQKKRILPKHVCFSVLGSAGAKTTQLVRCLLGSVSLARPWLSVQPPGREIKMSSCIWGRVPNHLHKSPLVSAPAHTELGRLHPQARLRAPPTGTGSWSLAPKLQKSRQDVQWVFSCCKFLHIKRKRKIIYVSRWKTRLQSSRLGCWKGQHTLQSLGQQSLPPPPFSLQTQARSMSAPKRRSRSSVRDTGGRRGCTPGKGKDAFVVFTRGNINYSVPRLALLF